MQAQRLQCTQIYKACTARAFDMGLTSAVLNGQQIILDKYYENLVNP
jgi:hypothetical protein